MIRKSKWINGTRPEQPVTEVARQAVALRLEPVWHYLPLAALSAEEDVEYVHQLRVASRRATAALDIFAALTPPRRRRQMVKWLKRIRRACGPARDDDVLAQRLKVRAAKDPAGGSAQLLAQVEAHRRDAQAPIVEVHRAMQGKAFDHRVAQLVDKLRWRGEGPEPTFIQAAEGELRKLANIFFTATEADLSVPQALHQLRIEAKRLRYAMEIFAGVFDSAFRESLYPQVEHLQELLGRVNDHATAKVRFGRDRGEADRPEVASLLEEMVAEEQAAFVESRDGFFGWWTPSKCGPLRDEFERYLG